MSSAITVNQIRQGFYLDSVALMRISARLSALRGVQEAALMIGSESNKQILQQAGLLAGKGRQAGPNDLIIGIRADNADAADKALAIAKSALDNTATATVGSRDWQPKSIAAAMNIQPDSNLALISVAGEFASREAFKALKCGLNVMIFSDNIPIEEELKLKQKAQQAGLLLMGPDCGTALINGVPLAFANAIPSGEIGVIAASGTGLQEFSVLVARSGKGISHGIGVGGRDLSDPIGGISTLTALELLERDRNTEIIVLISKPPGAETVGRIMRRLEKCRKPVVVCFLGRETPRHLGAVAGVSFATTLKTAAEQALRQSVGAAFVAAKVAASYKLADRRRWLRALYTGGTLCAEAQVVLRQAGLTFTSNVPIPGAGKITGSGSHTLIDLGADEYTMGRPHPMLEPEVRSDFLRQSLQEPAVAVILLDLVLGFGAHPNPAANIAEIVSKARNPRPLVVASVCGVNGDPQDYRQQVNLLESAGIIVAPSNAQAAELVVQLVKRQA